MIYHVSIHGCDTDAGTADAPFRTINRAASVAVAGDTVRVHEGEYREWVQPQNGGRDDARIIYEAAQGEHVVIKGSEVVSDWERVEGTVWKRTLPNETFGDWNPYATELNGDWLVGPTRKQHGYFAHLGDVYINGKSMFEASSMDDLYDSSIRARGNVISDPILYPERTVYRWYARVDETTTTIFGNFGAYDPNAETVEINVRKACFYPTKNYLNYITVRGFEIAHAACPFTPPTADQVGMVGPHWSRGWIIENNHLHDAKCSAVSLGKEASTGDNDYLKYNRRLSHYYQTEAVFRALEYANWDKEHIGSHIVRDNLIHDCGQNGIVGHMGCAFSRIEHNRIYNIGIKREFYGHELGGIKFHAAIDVVIENNNISHCNLGTWLDWQAQGTRLTRNVYHHNGCDLMIEVTHGPCLLDHNFFLSENAFHDWAQGTAMVHNLIAGNAEVHNVLERQTPYHFPHSTHVLGVAKILGGDNRIYNNLMTGSYPSSAEKYKPMSACYNDHYTPERFYGKMEAHDFHMTRPEWQAMWVDENAYAGYASPFRAERNPIFAQGMTAALTEENGEWRLTLNVPESVAGASCTPVTTERLGAPVYTEEPYENPDGTPIDFTRDFYGAAREGNVIPGPLATLKTGAQSLVVWKE